MATYFSCSQYLNLHYIKNESELEKIYLIDGEGIVAGRIPATYSEKLESVYTYLRSIGTLEEEVEKIRYHIEENSLDFREIYTYLEKERGMEDISLELERKYSEKKGQ